MDWLMIFELLGIVSIVIWAYVTLLFLISLVIKRNDIADVAWGPGIAIVGIVSILYVESPSLVHILIVSSTCIWATRLAVRISIRNSKKNEDSRYAQWRTSWRKFFYVRSYGQVYVLQGFLMIVMGYIFIHVAHFDSPVFIPSVFIGLLAWLFGFVFEIISDYQLDQFISNKNNKGAIMQSGLWKYSRHPNYFGEVTLWWGLWITVATSLSSFIALISPLLITFLILKVSGIPMAEKHLKDKPGFKEYAQKTRALFPLPK
jgi:steroid 5-alpha reductase family enzyme